MEEGERRLMTVPEVATTLGITKNRAYELCKRDVLPVVRLGRQVRVDAERLEAFIEAGGASLDAADAA